MMIIKQLRKVLNCLNLLSGVNFVENLVVRCDDSVGFAKLSKIKLLKIDYRIRSSET